MIYDENVSEQLLPVAACFSDLSQFAKRFKKHLGGKRIQKTRMERQIDRVLNESKKAVLVPDEAIKHRDALFEERCSIVMSEYAKLRNAIDLQFGEAGCRRPVDGILALLWDISDIDGTVFR